MGNRWSVGRQIGKEGGESEMNKLVIVIMVVIMVCWQWLCWWCWGDGVGNFSTQQLGEEAGEHLGGFVEETGGQLAGDQCNSDDHVGDLDDLAGEHLGGFVEETAGHLAGATVMIIVVVVILMRVLILKMILMRVAILKTRISWNMATTIIWNQTCGQYIRIVVMTDVCRVEGEDSFQILIFDDNKDGDYL